MKRLLLLAVTLIYFIVLIDAYRASDDDILLSAKACAQSYKIDTAVGSQVDGLTLVKFFKNPKGSFCKVFVTSDNTLVITYRGSASVIDWKNNFKTIPVPAILGPDMERHGSVHEGFMVSYMVTISELKTFLEQALSLHSFDRIIFTGHSQGGAVAMIAAYDFLLHHPEYHSKVQLITFGQPRVGKNDFTSKFDKVLQKYTRLVSVSVKELKDLRGKIIIKSADEDLVANVPSTLTGFKHVGEKIQLLCESMNIIICHDISIYQSAIEKDNYLN